jgi:hypothetical protein
MVGTPSGLIKLVYKKTSSWLLKINWEKWIAQWFYIAITFDTKSNIWMSTKTEIVKYNEQDLIISYGDNDGIKQHHLIIEAF